MILTTVNEWWSLPKMWCTLHCETTDRIYHFLGLHTKCQSFYLPSNSISSQSGEISRFDGDAGTSALCCVVSKIERSSRNDVDLLS